MHSLSKPSLGKRHIDSSHFLIINVPFDIQKGKDDYKLAATSEDDGNKKNKKEVKKAKEKKDMDDLKKEVDLVRKTDYLLIY